MEQDKEPRNKPMHIRQTNFQQRCQEYTMGRNSAKAMNQDFFGYSLILRSIFLLLELLRVFHRL